MQVACSLACSVLVADAVRLKAERRAAVQERAKDRAKREDMKTLPKLRAEAQTAFNKYIRLRDTGLPCFDCGRPMEPNKLGGTVDCGHFLGRGAYPNLALEPDNAFAERKDCNMAGGATQEAKRIGAIARIGLLRVEMLERDQTPRRYRKDHYRALRDLYKIKLKELTP